MDRFRRLVLSGCVGLGAVGFTSARAQSVGIERDASITGPGGRTIERHLSATRGGGVIDRQLSITRPGGTLERSVRAQVAPAPPVHRGGYGFGHGYGFAPPRHGHWHGPPPRSGINPLMSFGIGALAGAAVAAPLARMTAPSPVVVASPPVVVAAPAVVTAPPTVVVEQPMVVAPAVDPLDPVALAAQRLQSYYGGTRRDAAESLGLLGDPRGIPPLVDALRNDWNAGVRVAAATAIGRIGGPEAEAVLSRAVVFEKKESVRDAAAQALAVARARAAATAPIVSTPTTTVVESRPHVESPPRAAATTPARPPAWRPGTRAQTDAVPLEAPSLDDLPVPDRVPPPPAPMAG